jgi:hypothetical protein
MRTLCAQVPTALGNEDEEEAQAGRKKKTKQTVVSVFNEQHRSPDGDGGHRNRCTTQAGLA